MFVLNLHFWKFGYGEGRRNWRFPVLEMEQDISFCHYLFIESNSTSGSYSSLEMDPQEALKNAGAELIAEGLIVNDAPDEEGCASCEELGKKLAEA